MELLACLLSVCIGFHHALVLHDGAVLAGTVNLHQVLIDNAAGADVEVSHLRVAHLSVWQAHVFAACHEL